MFNQLYENDLLYSIAGCVFIGLTEALAVSIAIIAKFQWWLFVLIILGAFILSLAYRPLAEYVLCTPAIGMIALIVYDLVSRDISLPTIWVVLIIIWEVIFIAYMVFFSTLRESIDEYRRRI